ncbi:hypothetical protein [Gordonibacter massiliensis (ex Traore et al. 2017)]|uniref:Uncharacterized protein n=1 Tax=Gordonibacter massiliensis (ex Traore et al. 2017) TaxID=1841863 RepID=A0A842J8H5_9ACTN|nr:hypothetical protein [Gordonibacter massiliensis (ex Traore et al. 2017)]MBC2888322.1 hypothetical protein [Gordonibacter massiliensis (ex Traore et al. 2017)]
MNDYFEVFMYKCYSHFIKHQLKEIQLLLFLDVIMHKRLFEAETPAEEAFSLLDNKGVGTERFGRSR